MHARVITLLLALAVILPAPVSASQTARTDTWFLRNAGTACGDNAKFELATRPGGAEPNCGYVGGISFGEGVFDSTKVFTAREGVPFVLDADRGDAEGVIRILHAQGLTGAGTLTINVKLMATDPEDPFVPVTLGTTTLSGLVSGTGGQNFPFTMPLDDGLDGRTFSELSLSVEVRGVHAGSGYLSVSNGDSRFSLPTLAAS